MGIHKLVLLRHGESQWNLENRFTGWTDVDLTENGIAEAQSSGQLLKDESCSFNLVYTSVLKRAIKTMELCLNEMDLVDIPIKYNWRLNERHYGALQGLNKAETAKKYGEKQVQIWRRSFDTRPPPMDKQHPYRDKIKSNILSESLKDTIKRVIPYYEKKIKPLISAKKNILIVFHGNSCRALLMEIFNISKEKIVQFEIPTGNPLLIQFEDNLKVQNYKYLDAKRAKKILFNV